MVFLCTPTLIVAMIGVKMGEPLPKWRENLIKIVIWPFTRIHLLCSGMPFIGWQFRPDVDYSKWLGPDWKPTFEGAGI